jgi:hypothetical protein
MTLLFAAIRVRGKAFYAHMTYADVFPPPPIPGIDFLYLGSPAGPVIGLAAAAATVALFRLLRRRNVHGCLSLIAAGLVFLVADCTSYFVGLDRSSRARRERREERWREQQAAAASASAAGSSAPPPR